MSNVITHINDAIAKGVDDSVIELALASYTLNSAIAWHKERNESVEAIVRDIARVAELASKHLAEADQPNNAFMTRGTLVSLLKADINGLFARITALT